MFAGAKLYANWDDHERAAGSRCRGDAGCRDVGGSYTERATRRAVPCHASAEQQRQKQYAPSGTRRATSRPRTERTAPSMPPYAPSAFAPGITSSPVHAERTGGRRANADPARMQSEQHAEQYPVTQASSSSGKAARAEQNTPPPRPDPEQDVLPVRPERLRAEQNVQPVHAELTDGRRAAVVIGFDIDEVFTKRGLMLSNSSPTVTGRPESGAEAILHAWRERHQGAEPSRSRRAAASENTSRLDAERRRHVLPGRTPRDSSSQCPQEETTTRTLARTRARTRGCREVGGLRRYYFEHGASRETSRGSFQLVNVPSVQANRAPRVTAGIEDATLEVGDRPTVDLEAPPRNFTDPDGDRLRYSATSRNTRVARVSLSGTVLEVLASDPGQASIRVTATDPGGLSATLTFRVTVTAGTTGEGVVTTHAGACRVGSTLGPGGSCDVGSDRFEVLSDGRGRYGCCITAGTGINVNGFRASRISGTNWRIDALP